MLPTERTNSPQSPTNETVNSDKWNDDQDNHFFASSHIP